MENIPRECVLGVDSGRLPPKRCDILRVLRESEEQRHRKRTLHFSANLAWIQTPVHKPINFESLSGLREEDAYESCNRTVPIFVLRNADLESKFPFKDTPFWSMNSLLVHLHRHVYNRWFQPYASEIDHGQFLTKVHLPPSSSLPTETCCPTMIEWVQRLSANLVARTEYTKKHGNSRKYFSWDPHLDSNSAFYHVQPLFEAVALAIRAASWNYEKPAVEKLPVLIVRTGVEKNLSAPITFDTIATNAVLNTCVDENGSVIAVETTFESAITFVLELESREAKTQGTQCLNPNIVMEGMAKQSSGVERDAELLGWNTEEMGPLQGSSSTWARGDGGDATQVDYYSQDAVYSIESAKNEREYLTKALSVRQDIKARLLAG